VKWLGEVALRAHVYSWQHGVRIGLTITGLALAVIAVRRRPRWTGILALFWALASVAELPTTI
jgi:hypothetical protein